mgnify:CR=1 FL=1
MTGVVTCFVLVTETVAGSAMLVFTFLSFGKPTVKVGSNSLSLLETRLNSAVVVGASLILVKVVVVRATLGATSSEGTRLNGKEE